MTSDKHAVDYGKRLACILAGVEPSNLEYIEKMAATLEDQDHPLYGMVQRCWAKAGAAVLEAAGDAGSLAHALLVKAASVETWYPDLDRFIEPVTNAFARYRASTMGEQGEYEEHVKAAGVLTGLGAMIPGAAAEAIPFGAKMMLGAPALAGVGAGSLYWLLKRQAHGETEKEQLIRARIHQYRQLADDIKNEMANKAAPEEQQP